MVGELVKILFLQSAILVLAGGAYAWMLPQERKHPRRFAAILGILFGLMGVGAMHYPIALQAGYIFDIRGVVVILATVFGGIWGGLIATLIIAVGRLALAGAGVWVGVLSIALAFGVSASYRLWLGAGLGGARVWHFLLLGGVVHLLTVGLFELVLPAEFAWQAVSTAGLAMLIINPPLTLVFGFVLLEVFLKSRAEEEVASLLTRLRVLFDNLPDLVWLKNPGGRYLACNKRFEDFAGRSESELIGLTDNDLFEPALAERFRDNDRKAVEAGQSRINEEEVTFASDGRRELLETIKTPMRNHHGELVGVLGIARPITDRVRMQRALDQKDGDLHNIFEKSTIGKVLLGLDGTLLAVNKYFADLIGYDVAELTTEVFTASIYPEDRVGVEVISRLLLPGDGDQAQAEKRFLHRDGHIVWTLVSAFLLRDLNGDPVNLLVNIQDLSQLKAAQRALSGSESRFGVTIANVIEVVTVYDPDLKIRAINGKTRLLTGLDVKDFIGRRDDEVLPEPVVREYMAHLAKARDSGEPQTATLSVAYVADTLRSLQVVFIPLKNDLGQVSEVIGITHDFTDLDRANETIRDYVRKLEVALKGSVSVAMSLAEIRDPYTAGHERRVADLAIAIARELQLGDEQIEGLRVAGRLHDIGKIAIPQEILAKPGGLGEAEFELVKQHPKIGYDILQTVTFPWPVADIVLQHHERLDGSGYPTALKGDEILIEARILAVADVVEAMSSHRPYRPALGIDVALDEIRRGRGLRYEERVVDACVRLFETRAYQMPD